jgi:hypothetical protein
MRAYTLKEIDHMRQGTRERMQREWMADKSGGFYLGDLYKEAEERLRTYLGAGVDPSEFGPLP